mmetsp:Transcript_24554/g.40699  ORF Transcript_24554/g.40699 Transcript_24554/m.40699 type:complete len:205 (-) Transcript_24554:554-1168(-)
MACHLSSRRPSLRVLLRRPSSRSTSRRAVRRVASSPSEALIRLNTPASSHTRPSPSRAIGNSQSLPSLSAVPHSLTGPRPLPTPALHCSPSRRLRSPPCSPSSHRVRSNRLRRASTPLIAPRCLPCRPSHSLLVARISPSRAPTTSSTWLASASLGSWALMCRRRVVLCGSSAMCSSASTIQSSTMARRGSASQLPPERAVHTS